MSEAKKAEKRPEKAEADAAFAIDFAYAAIEEAEYAVARCNSRPPGCQ